jgi:hypothetical protein
VGVENAEHFWAGRDTMDLSYAMKVESHGGGLKMGWSKPLRGKSVYGY